MENQNYKNHIRLIPMFHGFLFLLVLSVLGGAINNVRIAINENQNLYNPTLILVIAVICLLFFFFMRIFSLKAQDRAIRAEENLRHFALTGKLLDSRLTIQQIIGLRFASSDEFVALAKKAADGNMSQKDIKKAIKNWKGDYYRV
jgi:hypothetical protein